MSHTRYDQGRLEASLIEHELVVVAPPERLARPSPASRWADTEEGDGLGFEPYVVRRAPEARRAPESDPHLRRLSQNVECLRAACATAGVLRRWWLNRRLLALEREKRRLEQATWRRR